MRTLILCNNENNLANPWNKLQEGNEENAYGGRLIQEMRRDKKTNRSSRNLRRRISVGESGTFRDCESCSEKERPRKQTD